MKYLLQILILINISVLADIAEIQKLYNDGQYEKAIVAAKAYEKGYANPELHLLWAKSAQALGRRAEAMSAYERVTLLDENNTEARVALVEMYRADNIPELANRMKDSLKSHKLTPEQAIAIKEKGLKKITAKASLSAGYDTNINIYPDDPSLIDYNTTSGATKTLETLFGRFVGSVNAIDDLDEKGGWYARFGFGLFHQNNFDYEYYNLTIGSIEIGPGYVGESYSVYLPFNYSVTHYLDRELFEQTVFNPRFNYYITENLITNFSVNIAHRNYLEEIDNYKDGGHGGVSLGLYYMFGSDYAYIYFKNDEFHRDSYYNSMQRFLDKEIDTTAFGIKYTLNSNIVTNLDFKFRDIFYYDSAYTITNPDYSNREDDYSQVQLKFSYNIKNNFELYVSDMYSKNKSNYLPAEYKKNVTMLGISVKN